MSREREVDLVVIGGGISGLAAAYYNHKELPQARIAVLEAAGRLGGTIITERHESCLLDAGPDSFVTTKPAALELVKELGLASELVAPDPARNRIFTVRNDRLVALPKGMALGLPTRALPFLASRAFPWSMKIRMGWERFQKPRVVTADESIGVFMRRHFGRQAVDLLIEPILGGIFAGNADELSLNATFPQMRELEARSGSLIKGFRALRNGSHPDKPVFYSLKSGMGELIETLAAKLPQEMLHLCTPVQSVARGADGQGYRVVSANGEIFRAKAVICAIPAPLAARIFADLPDVGHRLAAFRSVSSVTVFLAFQRSAVPTKAAGWGFIVPRTESARPLAGTYISDKFPNRAPEDVFLMRLFFGGAGREEYADLPEADLVAIARRELAVLMGIRMSPLFTRVYYWKKSSPQYDVGHLERLQRLREAVAQFPGLSLIGNSYSGIGMADCIRQAKESVAR